MPHVHDCVAWLAPQGCGVNEFLDPEYSCIEGNIRLVGLDDRHACCNAKLPRHAGFDVCFSFPNATQGRQLALPASDEWTGFRVEITTAWQHRPPTRALVFKIGWLVGGFVRCFNRYRHPHWKPANVHQVELSLYPMTSTNENGITDPYASFQWEVLEGSRRIEAYVHRDLPHGLELDDYVRSGTPANIFRPGGIQRRVAIASDKKFFVRRDEFWRQPRKSTSSRDSKYDRPTTDVQRAPPQLKRSAPDESGKGKKGDGDETRRPTKRAKTNASGASSWHSRQEHDHGEKIDEEKDATTSAVTSAFADQVDADPKQTNDMVEKLLNDLMAISRKYESSQADPASRGGKVPPPATSPPVERQKTEDPRLKMVRFQHRLNYTASLNCQPQYQLPSVYKCPAPSLSQSPTALPDQPPASSTDNDAKRAATDVGEASASVSKAPICVGTGSGVTSSERSAASLVPFAPAAETRPAATAATSLGGATGGAQWSEATLGSITAADAGESSTTIAARPKHRPGPLSNSAPPFTDVKDPPVLVKEEDSGTDEEQSEEGQLMEDEEDELED
ncbi:hypothetical protein ACQY0O_002308 [Thecaphora frezii]